MTIITASSVAFARLSMRYNSSASGGSRVTWASSVVLLIEAGSASQASEGKAVHWASGVTASSDANEASVRAGW